MFMKAKLLVIISMVFTTVAFAQSVKTLEYNVGNSSFTGLLPFDQPFNLKLINIPKGADHITVRLIEVPKKNYNKIAKYKRSLKSNVVTAQDVYNYKQNESYSLMLDEVIKGENLSDTFCSLSVPFYLKPESKYLIDIKSFVKRELTTEEQTALVDFIINNRLYQQAINDLIIPYILNPELSFAPIGTSVIRLQNVVQQVVQAKHRNYFIDKFNYDAQLEMLSQFITKLNNISDDFTDMDTLVVHSRNALAAHALPAVRQSNADLTNELKRINWMQIQRDDGDYTNFITHLNIALAANRLLMDGGNTILIDDKKNNITQALNDAIELKNLFNVHMANFIAANANNQSVIASTNHESLVEQAKLHVAFDLGYAYVGQIDRGNAYAALHLYFRSIDTSLPLKNYKIKFWDFIGARTSLLIGTSIQSIQKDSVRKGLLSNDMALVTGLGFRLLPWFRINGGAYMYYLYSRNPLRTKNDYSFKASPFISISIDFNLSSFLGTFGNGNLFNNIFKK